MRRCWLTRGRATQGIDATVDYKKVLKAFKKEFCCNGTVVEDPEQARCFSCSSLTGGAHG